MDILEIEKKVRSYIEQSLGGQEAENPKCDFKAIWYDLQSAKGVSEFLKDTSAIANTFGPDGFIIIGYDEKTQKFYSTSFVDSKLKDTSYLNEIINKRVDTLFDINVHDVTINSNKLSVIHIPPSIDKPHVIKNHQTFDKNNMLIKEEQQRIFVRKNTSTWPASKNDIELMFYDRKNIIPDYKILCSFHTDTLFIEPTNVSNQDPPQVYGVKAGMNLVFENLGKRPVAIIDVSLSFTLFDDPGVHDIMHFKSDSKYKSSEIIVQPNNIQGISMLFRSDFYKHGYEVTMIMIDSLTKAKKNINVQNFLITLSTGEKIKSDLTIL